MQKPEFVCQKWYSKCILTHLVYLNPASRVGDVPHDGKPISLNGNIFLVCGILKFVSTSAAEAKLGVLFINGKQ